jgi:membrane fusion protein (multidrug efflux system)
VVVQRRALVELQGRYRVYVVTPENTVAIRELKLGPVKGNEVVVESGLNAGEKVIVEGTQKVRAGMPVNSRPAEQAPAPGPMQEA